MKHIQEPSSLQQVLNMSDSQGWEGGEEGYRVCKHGHAYANTATLYSAPMGLNFHAGSN